MIANFPKCVLQFVLQIFLSLVEQDFDRRENLKKQCSFNEFSFFKKGFKRSCNIEIPNRTDFKLQITALMTKTNRQKH